MARNGSGVYSKPSGTTAVAATTIESAKFNTLMDDIVNDLNAARPITAGGTGATSASGAIANLGLAALYMPIQPTTIELGHATDTTIARVSAGLISVEGVTIADVSTAQTLTNKTLTSPTINAATITAAIINTPASVDWSGTEVLDPANGDIQDITLTGDVTTLTDSMADGESIILQIDDGTAYAITWPAITWISGRGSAPTLQTSGDTFITIFKNGSTLFGNAVNEA